MRLIDADVLKEKFKEHYDLFVSGYKNEQDMSLADKSRVDEILNSMAEIINAPTVFDTDNATNGDVIKAMFSCLEKYEYEEPYTHGIALAGNDNRVTWFANEWWNSPYQKAR